MNKNINNITLTMYGDIVDGFRGENPLNYQGTPSARFVSQFVILMGISNGVDMGRKCKAAGRAAAELPSYYEYPNNDLIIKMLIHELIK